MSPVSLAELYISRLPVPVPGSSLRVIPHGLCHSLPGGGSFVELTLYLPPGAEEVLTCTCAYSPSTGSLIQCPRHLGQKSSSGAY